jgi:hypothetical protein
MAQGLAAPALYPGQMAQVGYAGNYAPYFPPQQDIPAQPSPEPANPWLDMLRALSGAVGAISRPEQPYVGSVPTALGLRG